MQELELLLLQSSVSDQSMFPFGLRLSIEGIAAIAVVWMSVDVGVGGQDAWYERMVVASIYIKYLSFSDGDGGPIQLVD